MNRNFGNEHRDNRFGDRPRNNDFGQAPPVNVGEELDVRIEAVGEKGDGVAKKNGFVIFVPGVKEGQNVRVKVTRVLRKVGFAEVIGAASAAPANKPQEKQAEAEEEYSPENDSDNFGEEQDSETPDLSDNPESEDEAQEDEEEEK